MGQLTNPRGRVFVFESEIYIDDDPAMFLTVSSGLASEAQMAATSFAPESEMDGNPPLELWSNRSLIGLCYLNTSADTASEMDILEEGGTDDLYYHVEFDHIWIHEDHRGNGMGRMLTAIAAQHAASQIAEHLASRPESEASVVFNAYLVSSGGESLYDIFTDSVERQLEIISAHFGKELTYTNHGGW